MDIVQSMRVFVKVAELGSFTKAADALQIGRPQATLTIRDLEQSLGTRLFQRTTRKVSLTTEGETFLERAEEIIASVAEATSLFGRPGGRLAGKLRIDIPSAFAQSDVLLASIKEFATRHPDIEIILGVTDRNIDIVGESVDCALRIGELQDSSLVARRIGSAVMITCASPGYLDVAGRPRRLSDLPSHKTINFLSGSSRRPLTWQFTQEEQPVTYAGPSSILVNDSHAYVEAGLAGFGIMQAPGILVKRYLADGRLEEVLEQFRPDPRPVSLLYPSKRFLSPQVKSFMDWLQTSFPTLNMDWLRSS